LIIKRLTDLALGTVDIAADNSAKGKLFDFLIRSRIGYEIVDAGDSDIIRIRSKDAKKYSEEIISTGAKTGKTRGLPKILKKYSKRYGIYLGVLFFTAIVIISQRLVWRIDVTGSENVDDKTIIDNLEELGFTYGTDFKTFDLDKLHNDYLRTYDDLSWISVNMTGTWANVEVKELSSPNEREDSGISNVVAAEKGKITMIETHSGKPMIKVGDYVSEGDLLMSGIITVGEDGLRYEGANGKVFAEVFREFTVEIPKTALIKVYTGDEYTEKSFIFFKKSIKLSGKYRISHIEYDKIYNTERLFLLGEFPLPFFNETVLYREFYTVEKNVSSKDADEEFDRLYSSRLDSALDGAKLVSVSTIKEENETSYIYRCSVICEADIAKRKGITIK